MGPAHIDPGGRGGRGCSKVSLEAASQARGESHDKALQVAGASLEAASQARGEPHDKVLQVVGASFEASSGESHDTALQVARVR